MALVGRFGGALLAAAEGRYFLVGDLKEPVDFVKGGFRHPEAFDPQASPYVELWPVAGPVTLAGELLCFDLSGEALAKKLAAIFIIKRNGSVSDRIWRLVTESSETVTERGQQAADTRWLGATPTDIFDIVRDAVLRCS